MADRSLRLRALLYLYGNANLLGCALALLGPVLMLAGVIDRGWLAITVGLYAIGALLAPRSPALERHIADSLTLEQTLEHLDQLVAHAQPHLADDMRAHLASIRESVAAVLPRLLQSVQGGDELFTVRETVLRYLPETLANYVALPAAFRTNHPLEGGRTARDLLREQLGLLDARLRDVVANVASSDAQALLANGEFLKAKFNQPDFLAR